MSLFSFLTRRNGLRRKYQPYRFRPRLEMLEGRALPSTLTVLNTLDSGAGSLRAAIFAADSRDMIEFAGSVHGQTITLTSGELALSRSLDIEGPADNPVVISGKNASRVFDIKSSSATVTLSGLTITQGSDAVGGGIANVGTLTVSHCTLSGNSAFGGIDIAFGGGGILNFGTLIVSHSTLSRNSTGVYGGGIFNGGTLTVSDSTLSGNTAFAGGGIFNAGTLTVSHSTLSGSAANDGGGIYNANTLTVSDSTLSGNTAFGGGGGIANVFGATLTVSHSTLSGNTASNGGGILNNVGASLNVLDHSTICGNFAPSGANLFNLGTFTKDDSSTICP